jgi:hypothetical protein
MDEKCDQYTSLMGSQISKKKVFVFFLPFFFLFYPFGLSPFFFLFFIQNATYIHTDLPWKKHRLIAVTAPTATRAVRGVAVVIILVLVLGGSRVAVYKSAELIDLGLKLRRRVDERLMAQQVLDREGRHERKVDILARGRELVVGLNEAEEVQDHTRMTHVEAKSEVRAGHRHAPALILPILGSTSRWQDGRLRGRLCGRIARLALKNHSGHLLCKVAKSRLMAITVLVTVRTDADRGTLGLLGGRRRICWDERRHVCVVILTVTVALRRATRALRRTRVGAVRVQRRRATALRPRASIGDGKTGNSVRHDGVTVSVVRREDVRGRKSDCERGNDRRHLVESVCFREKRSVPGH